MKNEIKPVYQEQFLGANKAWVDITPSRFKCLSLQKKPNYEFRILYPAAAYEAQTKLLCEAVSRIKDMLKNDDGQAHKEARKFIESLKE